jgi:hypothetical protein
MTALYRMRTALTGFSGAPGVVTQYFSSLADTTVDLHTFWESVKVYIPSVVHVQVENVGDIIESTTGTITDAWQAAPVAETVCTGGGAYAGPAGAQIRWDTATIVDGRRLRGRTFLVPLVTGAYESNGTILGTALTAFTNAAAALVNAQAPEMVVWHRPRAARAADGSRPEVTARAGSFGAITASSVPDRVAVLRSRRG